MAGIHFVELDGIDFSTIKNNKNHFIGVLDSCSEEIDVETLDRLNQFFIVRCVGIENIFDNQALPTNARNGDLILLSQVGEEGLVDEGSQRITIKINEVHHFQNGLDSLCEINISFYEYTLLHPSYFFYEGADNGK
ncbi:hypothetical protein [Xenorhabdus sp. Sc-CR9]|uniref:hypothetical protein n=1 Tax=Xenorhabdus sp. Sc-CR9 TaxID=2584468 RepID=UPI001F4810B2|nr:hypothetical protein [Xenorhabdus sp. Sc-CR9]